MDHPQQLIKPGCQEALLEDKIGVFAIGRGGALVNVTQVDGQDRFIKMAFADILMGGVMSCQLPRQALL
jgi:hypothetical protein